MFARKKFGVVKVIQGLAFILLLACFFSCKNYHRNKTHAEISIVSIEAGAELANKYCQSCHLLPEPSLLDSKSWEKGVLPHMGPMLGIFYYGFERYPSLKNDRNLAANFYPSRPVLSYNQWQNIIDYYTATSPDTLNEANPGQRPIKMGLSLFAPLFPANTASAPATSLVKIIGESTSTEIVVSDATKQTLYRFDDRLNVFDSIQNRGPVVDVEVNGLNWLTCDIGVLNPNNGKYGSGRNAHIAANSKLQQDSTVLFEGLQRPVQITSADLNKDGKRDYVVCEYGYLTGALSWMENLGNGKYDRHVLRPFPGAIKAYVNDYNHDGLPDLWVLFAQGMEGVFLYTNKADGRFEEKKVIGFPAVYGSSYFELVDYNKDGSPDVVYTCGDNADYSAILKPYHGVYIYLNDGKNNFRQVFFYHINGCFKAIARDFDNDNDLDIATISFFADYRNKPEEGFVYLENVGNYNFNPYSLPETQKGRWLTMDAGDINRDGKTDLILGNFSIGPSILKSTFDWKKAPAFMVLENTGRK